MARFIDEKKQYKVSGRLLYLLFCLRELYNLPIMVNDEMQPFPEAHILCNIGRIIEEFDRMEWEEV